MKKFIKESEEYYQDCSFSVTTYVNFRNSNYINSICDKFRTQNIGLFDWFFFFFFFLNW